MHKLTFNVKYLKIRMKIIDRNKTNIRSILVILSITNASYDRIAVQNVMI